ncbi:MAG: hypothetical protein GTO18_21700 [Anaerolineales bacterium]|nr:hypothetical protein [Anaerolineales bacterium]
MLAPGGTLVVEEPDIRNIAVKFVALLEKWLLMRSHFIRPMAIAAILADLGAQTRVEIDGAIAWVVAEKELISS